MQKSFILILLAVFLFFSSSYAFAEQEMTKDDKARLGLAQSLSNLGRYDEAVEALTGLHQAYPENTDITLALAQALGFGLKLDEARTLLEQLVKQFPEDENIQYTYANILEANQRFTEARERYLKLLMKKPHDEDLQLKIADVSSWMGDYETAIRYYTSLLDRKGEDLSLKKKLADVFLWSKDYEGAIKLYRELGVNPRDDKKRYKNLGTAFLGAERFDEALKIYRELLKLYPEDLEIRMDIADALYGAGRIEEAKKEFKVIIQASPQDIKLMAKIAEMLALRRQYDEAIKICNEILSIDPDNSYAKLWLARIYSWNRRYKESLNLYTEIIAESPEWITPRREKGRVLGWTRKYQKSVKEYKAIQDEVKPDEASRLEMLSKSNFYKIFDSSAIRYYKQWLKTEAEDLEALYDLGQAYARQMQWDNARNTYQAILNILPSHFRAEQALNKVNIYAKSPRAKLGFKFFEADSASRDMDKKYLDIYSSFKAPLREDLYFEAREDTYMYVYSHVGHVNRERISAGLEYYKKPYFWASGSYAYNIYSDGIDESHTSKEEVNIRPFDPTLFTLSHEHDDVLDNALTLKMRLEKDDYKIRGTASPNRRLSFGADYMYSDYNDGNERDAYGFDSSCILLYEPKFFKVTYRYEEYGFDEPRPEYFTPSSFHSNTLLLEWRHFLNKEELFWGTNDTYYTLKYGVNLDVHDLHGHTFYADFHKDWNDRFSTHVEWSKKMYEHRDVYSEDEVSAYITYYF